MKDTKTLLLGMLSLGLVTTWIYHFYDKSQYGKATAPVATIDSAALAKAIQDSMHRIYTGTISTLDARLDSTNTTAGNLNRQLTNKLAEVRRLKNEISSILERSDFNKADLELARKKTVELQQLVAELQNKNTSIEEEKKQIATVLDKVTSQVKNMEGTMQKMDQENKVLTEKVNQASVFVASDIKLVPVMVKNDKEQETSQVKKTSKLVVSFNVQNNIADYETADVFIVITQPDGRVLRNDDVWDASSMTLRNGSRMNFTRRIRFEYLKGESKSLIFSINAEEYLKGTYTLQVYHNGYLIGQTMKTLS